MHHVLFSQVRTNQVEERLNRLLCVVRWLHAVSTLSDGMCRLVCEIFSVDALVTLMKVTKNRNTNGEKSWWTKCKCREHVPDVLGVPWLLDPLVASGSPQGTDSHCSLTNTKASCGGGNAQNGRKGEERK